MYRQITLMSNYFDLKFSINPRLRKKIIISIKLFSIKPPDSEVIFKKNYKFKLKFN